MRLGMWKNTVDWKWQAGMKGQKFEKSWIFKLEQTWRRSFTFAKFFIFQSWRTKFPYVPESLNHELDYTALENFILSVKISGAITS